jgi:hypothetical protein
MSVMVEPVEYPLTDLSLARRLERAEGRANVAFVEARARVQPEVGAAWLEVAGVFAMFDGVDSPLTQTFGLGVFDHIGDAEFERLESFFRNRSARVAHEVSPLIPPDTLSRLNDRGYQPVEHSTVLIRPTALPTAAAPRVSAREIAASERGLWARAFHCGKGRHRDRRRHTDADQRRRPAVRGQHDPFRTKAGGTARAARCAAAVCPRARHRAGNDGGRAGQCIAAECGAARLPQRVHAHEMAKEGLIAE